MPHFDEDGNDTWICQICGQIQKHNASYTWAPEITGHTSAGATCGKCVEVHKETQLIGDALRARVSRTGGLNIEREAPISLYEHCRIESGGLTGQALQNYNNRYYGHG